MDVADQTCGEARPERCARALTILLAAAAALVFGWIGGYRLDRPGPYADEMLFMPAAAEALGDCAVDAQVSVAVEPCFPLYLSPPYLGAIKAWLHAPLLALGVAEPAPMRLPMLLLGALVVAGWVVFAARGFGLLVALGCAIVLATDPAFAIHARLDWGPVVIAAALKLLLVAAVWRWLTRGEPVVLAAAIVIALAGVYDKLSFLWVVGAVACAALAAAPDLLLARWRERSHRWWAGWVLACIPPAALVGLVAVRASRLAVGGDAPGGGLSETLRWVRTLYDQTFSAAFVRPWISGGAGEPVSWPSFMLLGLCVLALAVALLRPWSIATLVGPARRAAFLLVMLLACLAAIVATPQTSGAHHLVVLWPLPWIAGFALLQVGADALVHRLRVRAARVAGVAVVLVAIAAVLPTFASRQAELRALWDGRFGFATAFDPAIEGLSAQLAARPGARVVSVDWGLHQGLVLLAQPAQRNRFLDGWIAFNDPPGVADDRKDALRAAIGPSLPVLFVAYAPGRAILPRTEAHFAHILRRWSACDPVRTEWPGSDGRPLFSIVAVHAFDPSCARRP